MKSVDSKKELPTSIGIGVALILFVSLAYALLTTNIFLWLFIVVAVGFSTFIIYLFYRLVIAVEEISRRV